MTSLAASPAPAAGQVVTGVLGFLVVAAMGVALYFLLRSMNKQLRKVMRDEPRWREGARRGGEPGGTGDSGGGEPGSSADGAGAGDGAAARPEQDYSRNGTGHPR